MTFIKLTVKELKAEAKARNLKGYSNLRKAELVELLHNADITEMATQPIAKERSFAAVEPVVVGDAVDNATVEAPPSCDVCHYQSSPLPVITTTTHNQMPVVLKQYLNIFITLVTLVLWAGIATRNMARALASTVRRVYRMGGASAQALEQLGERMFKQYDYFMRLNRLYVIPVTVTN